MPSVSILHAKPALLQTPSSSTSQPGVCIWSRHRLSYTHPARPLAVARIHQVKATRAPSARPQATFPNPQGPPHPAPQLNSPLSAPQLRGTDPGSSAETSSSDGPLKALTTSTPSPAVDLTQNGNGAPATLGPGRSQDASAHSPVSTPPPYKRPNLLRILWTATLRRLSSLELAVAEMALIGVLSAIATLIEQGETMEYYREMYPASRPALGLLPWDWLLLLQFDHIFSAWYFIGLLVLLGASLAACTSTRQWPMVKVARRWSFLERPSQFKRLEMKATVPCARLEDFATVLADGEYQVFVRDSILYAFKGLAGKVGPIGVHAALIFIMLGGATTAFTALRGTTLTPTGQEFVIGDVLQASGPIAFAPSGSELRLHVNDFNVQYRPAGEVEQFYSDLSVIDTSDREVYRKTINVNNPLRYGGVTVYQTDWSISAVQLRVDGGQPFRLPLAKLPTDGKAGKLLGTFLRTGDENSPRGVSIICTGFQSVVIYDSNGDFVGVRRPGSNKPIIVDGRQIVVEDLIGATGLELKSDPGVPVVYAGMAVLLITVFVSFMGHEQVWAIQQGDDLLLGGKTSKNQLQFDESFKYWLTALPEYPPSVEEDSAGGIKQGRENRPDGGAAEGHGADVGEESVAIT